MVRTKLAGIAADAYQLAGRHDSPGIVLDILYWICRTLDPVKVRAGHINPAMLKGIAKASGISFEELIKDENEAD